MDKGTIPAYRKLFLIAFLVLWTLWGSAQIQVRDSVVRTPMFAFSYTAHNPAGDMAERFGFSSMVGVEFTQKTGNNWLFTFRGGYMFGNDIKEDTIFDDLITSSGNIISSQGTYASIFVYQRGLHISARAGKLFPVIGPNPNSGIRLDLGAGYLMHRLRIEDSDNVTPQLNPDYRKGYDRLTAGMALSQFIGYHHQSNNRRINFYIGFEFVQAFTSNQRGWNFDQRGPDDRSRLDMLYGIKAGFIIPMYPRSSKNSRYYYF